MKNQALFSSKDNSKKLKCRLLQFLFGALRVKKGDRLNGCFGGTGGRADGGYSGVRGNIKDKQ